MKVLVACEESQRVCIAFRERGHEAYSCDIQECSGGRPEWHIQGDVLSLLNGDCYFFDSAGGWHFIDGKWDLIIAHPPCTYLSNVATRQYSLKCCSPERIIDRWKERAMAAVFFMQLMGANCDRIAIENPVGFMNSAYRKADQIIHPYFFADGTDDTENYFEKRTCLWLKGLQPLKETDNVYDYMMTLPMKERTRIWQLGGGHGKERSKTYPGIARAMAEQWAGKAED